MPTGSPRLPGPPARALPPARSVGWWGARLLAAGSAGGALAVVLAGMGACRRVVPWTPDPRVVHADTAVTSDGVRVAVERIAPPAPSSAHGAPRRLPAVLLLHPSDGLEGEGGAAIRRQAEQLALNGYVAWVVHYFDRTGVRRSDDAMEDRDWPVWTRALQEVVGFVGRDPAVDPRRIGAHGFSLGGYMALALGAVDPRVRALSVASGGFFPELARRFATGEATRLPPTLLLHGDADGVVPLAEARRVDSTLRRLGVPHRLVIFGGERHGFRPEADAMARTRALRFFDERLRGGSAAGRAAPVAPARAARPPA